MKCIIPSCKNVASHNFGVRLRRPDTSAIWAPNSEAYFCDAHAVSGATITVLIEPNSTGEIETKIVGLDPPTADRVTKINNPV